MKRLIEFEVDSPPMKEAKRLLASLPPVPESAERMWRIRRELDWVFLNSGHHAARASGLRLRGVTAVYRQLSMVKVAGLLLLCGASAFAAIRLISALGGGDSREMRPAPAQLTAAEAAPQAASDPGASNLAAPQTAGIPGDALSPPSLSGRDPEAKSRTHRARRMAARLRAQRLRAQRATTSEATGYDTRQEAPSRAAEADYPLPPASSEPEERAPASAARPLATGVTDNDLERKEKKPSEGTRTADEAASELVHRALRALRRDGDAALAARLLERHRARDPDGPLVEEALALQIEASAALGEARARGFAREYLTRYPSGRYRNVAERVLANSRP